MRNTIYSLFLFSGLLCLISCGKATEEPLSNSFQLESIDIGGIKNEPAYTNVNPQLAITLIFSDEVAQNTLENNITLKKHSGENLKLRFSTNNKIVIVESEKELPPYTSFQFIVNTGLKSASGTSISSGKVYELTTGINPTDKFPRISDDELLTLVQKQTFKYFWEFGHPVSGMARERTTSSNTVTTGGTGFGLMAMIVAAERGFITKQDALERIRKIVTFLDTKCTRYHGAFAHWIHGESGATLPFSTYDNGADLVETSLLFQ